MIGRRAGLFIGSTNGVHWGYGLKFSLDVPGNNFCQNCYFPGSHCYRCSGDVEVLPFFMMQTVTAVSMLYVQLNSRMGRCTLNDIHDGMV